MPLLTVPDSSGPLIVDNRTFLPGQIYRGSRWTSSIGYTDTRTVIVGEDRENSFFVMAVTQHNLRVAMHSFAKDSLFAENLTLIRDINQ